MAKQNTQDYGLNVLDSDASRAEAITFINKYKQTHPETGQRCFFLGKKAIKVLLDKLDTDDNLDGYLMCYGIKDMVNDEGLLVPSVVLIGEAIGLKEGNGTFIVEKKESFADKIIVASYDSPRAATQPPVLSCPPHRICS